MDLPFVSADGQSNEVGWWGDLWATVNYAKIAVPAVISAYGGNSSQVLLTGFSRGAIAVSFIGLYDDQISKLWTAFYSHCHFDGMMEWLWTWWGTPYSTYRQSAITRLKRLNGRPLFTSENKDSPVNVSFPFQLLPQPYDLTTLKIDMYEIFTNIPNNVILSTHNDKWLLACGSCPEGKQFQNWLNRALQLRYSLNYLNSTIVPCFPALIIHALHLF